MDPDVWARVQAYKAETHDMNVENTLVGYKLGMLTRRDLKSLKEGGQLTGDIASEIARCVTDGAPHVAFLDNAFPHKVTPPDGGDTRCWRQYWERNIGEGTGSQIGTARKTIVALHCVLGHWCCATADLVRHELI